MPDEADKKAAEAAKPLKPFCGFEQLEIMHQIRDACIKANGKENCTELIEAHKKCLTAGVASADAEYSSESLTSLT